MHKEKPTLIFRVRKGQGQSEPGEYQQRLSLQDRGTTLALSHVTPHDERVFLCQGKRPQSQEHRIQLRVYSECPSAPRGRCGSWAGEVPGPSFPSLVEAPEEPTIQVNPLGISVSSKEPVEVRLARWEARAQVGPGGASVAGRLTPCLPRWPPVWAEMGTPFLKSSGIRMATP